MERNESGVRKKESDAQPDLTLKHLLSALQECGDLSDEEVLNRCSALRERLEELQSDTGESRESVAKKLEATKEYLERLRPSLEKIYENAKERTVGDFSFRETSDHQLLVRKEDGVQIVSAEELVRLALQSSLIEQESESAVG